jgi:prepilin-type N-terminal cleavage/methylation domain-containing protein
MRKYFSRPEGFTLIELMIVILIIAILVAIAVPVYLNARANAQRRTCQSNLRTVDGSIQAYESIFDNPIYPAGMGDMTQPGTKTLKSVPQCPSSANPYIWVGGEPPEISCPSGNTGHRI